MRFSFLSLALLASALFLSGCVFDTESKVAPASVEGEWKVFKAMRDAKLTRELDRGYLHFNADSTLSSNFISSVNNQYTYHNGILEIPTKTKKIIFEAVAKGKDTLVLQGNINFSFMEVTLVK